MNISTKLFAVLAMTLIASCGGGGDGATPPATANNTSAGTASLVSGVQVLSDAQSAGQVSHQQDKVTFAGPLNVAVGRVVLTRTDAFKVVAMESVNGNTVLTVSEPALDELFEQISFSGNFEAQPVMVGTETANTVVGVLLKEAGKIAKAIGIDLPVFEWNSQPIFGVTTKLTGKVSASVEYSYSRTDGLQRADMLVRPDTEMQAKLSVSKGEMRGEKHLGTVRIPVPISIVDSVLALVGERLVSINIPFYVGAAAQAETEVVLTSGVTFAGELGVRYRSGSELQFVDTLAASMSEKDVVPTTPAGAPALPTFKANVGPYARMTPALAFLRVALVGVETRVSADAEIIIQVVPELPGYCFSYAPAVNLSANGFIKAAGVKERKSEVLSRQLFKGSTEYSGICKAPAVVDIVPTQTPLIYGNTGVVSVVVSINPSATFSAPTSPPIGTVAVRMGANVCTATLISAGTASASGQCSVVPDSAGAAVPVQLTYSGSIQYAPVVMTVNANVQRAGTTTGIAGIIRTTVGTPVTLTATVLTGAGPADPTGTIVFTDDSGKILCSAAVANSSAFCQLTFDAEGNKVVSANYSGDARYLGSASTHTIVVRPLQAAIQILAATCTPFSTAMHKVEISGTASGPVGAIIFASSGHTNPRPAGSRWTSCDSWTSTWVSDPPSSQLYCQRGPNDPLSTNFTGLNTQLSSGTAPLVMDAQSRLINNTNFSTLAYSSVPLTCSK